MENQKFNAVIWFEIYVDDLNRATKFYETVLNTKLEDMPMPTEDGDNNMLMRSFPSPGSDFPGAAGTLVKMDGMKAGGASTVIYFGSTDCSVEEARIAAAGGKVLQSKTAIGEHGFISIAIDTEGNTFGLHSMK